MDRRQVAVAVAERLGDALDRVRRRLVGNEMPRKFGRDVPRGRGMLGKVGQHCARLRNARLTVARAHDRLGAWLVRGVVERELAELAAAGKPVGADRPARECTRESGDVLLRVAAVHAERVQLENFARQVLVDAELAIAGRRASVATLRELRARADRSLVVQVQDHRGMRFDGGQQVGEPARDVRPDRFVLQCSGEREHLRLVGGDREMVGPEMDQSLAKRFFARDCNAIARRDLVEIVGRKLRAQPAQ